MKNKVRFLILCCVTLLFNSSILAQEVTTKENIQITNKAIAEITNPSKETKKKCKPGCKKPCCAPKGVKSIEGKKVCKRKKKCKKGDEKTASLCNDKAKRSKRHCKKKEV